MKAYHIIKLDNMEYDVLLVMCNANSPMDYLTEIDNDIKEEKIKGNILIDEILHVGNTDKRFIKVVTQENKGIKDSEMEFVRIDRNSPLRKSACSYLRENNLIRYSILSDIQKRMISKGISI